VLHTVNIITYDTLQNAATQLGLFALIDEVQNCFQVAIAFYYAPYQLPFLFAQPIVVIPAPVFELWEKYKDDLSSDHREWIATANQAYMEELRDIERLFTPCGSDLSSFGLADPGQRLNGLGIE
jgi:hypothetical protein